MLHSYAICWRRRFIFSLHSQADKPQGQLGQDRTSHDSHTLVASPSTLCCTHNTKAQPTAQKLYVKHKRSEFQVILNSGRLSPLPPKLVMIPPTIYFNHHPTHLHLHAHWSIRKRSKGRRGHGVVGQGCSSMGSGLKVKDEG